jgi:hypothetical protein
MTFGIPCAWNLAGGYQVEPDGSIAKVLEIHDNTITVCCAIVAESGSVSFAV